ncbi:MAG TPA: HK97 family phage prohead protease [Micromonosporaceae bacterium]|nr:HK97 family phage prohead protease [Micromonosporaceae bacterium]
MTDLTTVTFTATELRVPSMDERIIEGIVVPWNETSFLTPEARGERFLPGSMTRTIAERGMRVKLYRTHDHDRAIGRPLEWNAVHDAGLFGRFRIAQTPAGDEALHEVREGMLDAFSVGFRAIRTRRGDDGAREVLEAALHETSLAPVGAYDGAQVLAVRTPAVPALPPMPAVDLSPIGPFRRA